MYKNQLLMATIVLGNIPKAFFDLSDNIKVSLFSDRIARVDFFFMYYANAINFLIFAYCIHYSKGIDKRISKFILIICTIDFFHLLLFAKGAIGNLKFVLAILILLFMYRKEAVNYMKYLYRLWI